MESYRGSLDDIYNLGKKNGGHLVIAAFTDDLPVKAGEPPKQRVLEVCLPFTPVGKQVARLISESGLRVFSDGGQNERIYPTRSDLTKLKAILRKHGWKELARISREKYLLIWLSVLDQLHQLNWDIRQVYEPKMIGAFSPYANLALAELELWRWVFRFPDVANPLESIGVTGYEYWFLTSNEWQVEDCANTLCEVPKRSKIRVWAKRFAVISQDKNPFLEGDHFAPFRFTLLEAALHIKREFPRNNDYCEFLEKAWRPYVDAIKSLARAFRHGFDLGGHIKIQYHIPIIKGHLITTSENSSIKLPLKKPESTLTTRGKYSRKKA